MLSGLLSHSEKVNVGQKVGQLTVMGESFWIHINARHRISHVVVRCECGKLDVTPVIQITRENKRKTTCGCRINTPQWKWGEHRTRLFKIYNGMQQRCYNPKRRCYMSYGGRGILMDEWKNNFLAFKEWSLANGYADNLSIDRIDNDKGYSPENCRWVLPIVQANNSRHNTHLTAFGETKTVAEWSRDSRCVPSYHTLFCRIKSQLGRRTAEQILTDPIRSPKEKRCPA